MRTELSWTHYRELLVLDDSNEINFYINLAINQRLGYRELHERIKSDEYGRLPKENQERNLKLW